MKASCYFASLFHSPPSGHQISILIFLPHTDHTYPLPRSTTPNPHQLQIPDPKFQVMFNTPSSLQNIPYWLMPNWLKQPVFCSSFPHIYLILNIFSGGTETGLTSINTPSRKRRNGVHMVVTGQHSTGHLFCVLGWGRVYWFNLDSVLPEEPSHPQFSLVLGSALWEDIHLKWICWGACPLWRLLNNWSYISLMKILGSSVSKLVLSFGWKFIPSNSQWPSNHFASSKFHVLHTSNHTPGYFLDTVQCGI